MYRNLGWDQATCAKNLHITQRTLHNWETGRHDIPYTAYRLLRLLNRMELPGPSWAGWCFVAGVLYTPEGRPLLGTDGSWWSLLVRQAAMFRELTARGAEGRAEGAPLGGGASARAAAPGPDAHASGRREALAPLPLTAWPSSRQFQQPAQALNVSTPPPGNHGEITGINKRGVDHLAVKVMAKCHHYGNNPPTTPRTGTRRPHPMRTGRNQSQCPGLRCAGRLPTRSMWCSYNGQRCHLGGSSRPRYGPRSRPRPRSHPGRSPSSRRTPAHPAAAPRPGS
ncbi:VC1465 family Xer recombination activation factor [Comamonas faecalis]|uniref:VC1465 family Xer recombination activation factor n=1 Tax=Comamonas faecalis TaxID=1387849 RepID=UPI003CD0A5FA